MSADHLMPDPEIARLQAENERLKQALRPFASHAAAIAEHRPEWDHDGFSAGTSIRDAHLHLKPFRDARKLLNELETSHAR